jgi:hypothetical protein
MPIPDLTCGGKLNFPLSFMPPAVFVETADDRHYAISADALDGSVGWIAAGKLLIAALNGVWRLRALVAEREKECHRDDARPWIEINEIESCFAEFRAIAALKPEEK